MSEYGRQTALALILILGGLWSTSAGAAAPVVCVYADRSLSMENAFQDGFETIAYALEKQPWSNIDVQVSFFDGTVTEFEFAASERTSKNGGRLPTDRWLRKLATKIERSSEVTSLTRLVARLERDSAQCDAMIIISDFVHDPASGGDLAEIAQTVFDTRAKANVAVPSLALVADPDDARFRAPSTTIRGQRAVQRIDDPRRNVAAVFGFPIEIDGILLDNSTKPETSPAVKLMRSWLDDTVLSPRQSTTPHLPPTPLQPIPTIDPLSKKYLSARVSGPREVTIGLAAKVQEHAVVVRTHELGPALGTAIVTANAQRLSIRTSREDFEVITASETISLAGYQRADCHSCSPVVAPHTLTLEPCVWMRVPSWVFNMGSFMVFAATLLWYARQYEITEDISYSTLAIPGVPFVLMPTRDVVDWTRSTLCTSSVSDGSSWAAIQNYVTIALGIGGLVALSVVMTFAALEFRHHEITKRDSQGRGRPRDGLIETGSRAIV